MCGRSAFVKFLIDYHKKANSHGERENQGINELEAVREMLRMSDLESNTALHAAVESGHDLVVEELLEFEDPDFSYSANTNQETPLYIAARRLMETQGNKAVRRRYHSLLSMILNKFKSSAHGGPYGRTVLHAAAMGDDAKAVRIILNKKGNLTKERDENGQTPLHYAAHLGYYSIVQELLKRDESAAYVADKKLKMTPLLVAARQGHGRIVREIISRCPDSCEMVDKRGWNLLHFVAFRHNPAELRYFLEGDSETPPYASIRDLRDEKDALGITARQVFDAYRSGLTVESESLKNNLPSKKMKQIVMLLEEIAKEEVAEVPAYPIRNYMQFPSKSSIEKAKESHLVVAALIATVTFAAAIAVPGGYKSDEKGRDQGTPFFIRNTAFIAFVIADALAFIFSLSAVVILFEMPFPIFANQPKIPFALATRYTDLALWAVTVAFSTGTYAILQPSPWLAIVSCCIGLSVVYWTRVCLPR